ncbi:MAG: hypothetical protein IJM62_07065 [Lachnospiraceae bacterium]|nr:hypothetical protein [Lachnospiraceae bacterium]
MVDNKKLHLMCRGAIYEKEYGTEDLRRVAYTASDYVRYNVLKTLIGVTLSFVIITGIIFFMSTEEVLERLVELDFKGFFVKYAIYYVVVIIIYAVLSIMFYAYQYHKSKKRLKKYEHLLDRVNEFNGVYVKEKNKGGRKKK